MTLLGEMVKTYHGNQMNQADIRKTQQHRLIRLIQYAKTNSPYYRERLAGIDHHLRLEELPVTSKPTMMEHFNDLLTDRKITMSRIEEFTADIENVGRMIDGRYLIFKTSGSTGNPAVVLYDQQAIAVASSVAAFRTFARKEDYRAFMKHGKKTAGVFANYGFYLACGMSRYLQLKMPHKQTKITVDVNAPEEQIIQQLNEFMPSILSGYPSNLSLLADYDELTISPDVIITGGELLTDEMRKKLTDRFGCYVQTHYSCTEAGEIACECSEGHLHINEDWIIVEPVDQDNHPVGYNVRSDKVLITNLSNYIQPFIRYELTDRIIVHNEKCPCGKNTAWVEIEGRTDDILTFPNGVAIAPMSLYKILEEIQSIRRFQLVQKASDQLELRLIAEDIHHSFEKAKHDLTVFLHSKKIDNIRIRLSDIPPQADKTSGKFKHIYRDFPKE